MAISGVVAAVFAGIAGILAVSVTGAPLLGLIAFIALFFLISGGGLAFLSTLDLPTPAIIVIVLIIIIILIGKSRK